MPLPWFEPAVIFLGAIGGTGLILVLVYFLVKSGRCFCDVSKNDRDDTPELGDYTVVATDDTGTDITDQTYPVKDGGRKYVLSTGDLADKTLVSSEEDEGASGVAKIGEIVSETGNKISDELIPPSRTGSKKQRSHSLETTKRALGYLHLTLQYSKKDLFLFAVIHKISDLLPSDVSGVDDVRISMVLLPAKKYRSKTKFVSANEPEFGASFKFSNVSRADLFQSAMRFRLYGRHVRLGIHIGKEKLLGEVTVHLADVAQRERMTTSRPFKLPRK